mmetsp:Transcript_23487/g.44746  ORF Transcript_23487/g.44746 Transcript_23487/m.44746 type:complete len:117 (+) Transcript_23487:130-480(+)
MDVRRGVAMYEKVHVPIWGLIENMSYFACPCCGHRTNIFGHGGVRDEADELGVELLGQVPLQMEVREMSDMGKPIVLSDPTSLAAKEFEKIAARIATKMSLARVGQGMGPTIVDTT